MIITAGDIHFRLLTKLRQPRIVSEATKRAAPQGPSVAGAARGDRHCRDDREVGDDRRPELRVVRSCTRDDAPPGERHEECHATSAAAADHHRQSGATTKPPV